MMGWDVEVCLSPLCELSTHTDRANFPGTDISFAPTFHPDHRIPLSAGHSVHLLHMAFQHPHPAGGTLTLRPRTSRHSHPLAAA